MAKCIIAKTLLRTKLQDMRKMPDSQQATSQTKDQQGIDRLFESAINDMFTQFYFEKHDDSAQRRVENSDIGSK